MTETDSTKYEELLAQPPTLSGYYLDRKMKPARFFKALRAAKTKAFQSDDVGSVQATLADRDPDLSRTLALGLASRPPEAVERWVIDVARLAAGNVDPNLLGEGASAEAIFERLVHTLTETLQSKVKPVRLRAQNLVKLNLVWLIRRRSLDPLRALNALSEISRKRRQTIHDDGQKVLLRAHPSQWKTLTVVTNLSSEEVKEANETRDRAIQTREQLQVRVANLEKDTEAKQQENDSLSRELERLQLELASERSALEAQHRLRDLDASEAAARTRSLLTGRLNLLLSDARDALDFEPPHIEAARQRIDAARETIVQEVSDSNE